MNKSILREILLNSFHKYDSVSWEIETEREKQSRREINIANIYFILNSFPGTEIFISF